MPIPVIKYRCKFKCGKKSVSNEKRMDYHEKQCWNNPENKTCKTCKNEVYYTDGDGFTQWTVRSCKISSLMKIFESCEEKMKASAYSDEIRPIYNCPYHNSDEVDTKGFADEVISEIGSNETGTIHFPFYVPTPINF